MSDEIKNQQHDNCEQDIPIIRDENITNLKRVRISPSNPEDDFIVTLDTKTAHNDLKLSNKVLRIMSISSNNENERELDNGFMHVINTNADVLYDLCRKIEELEEMIDEPDWNYDETPKVSPCKTMVTDICGDVYPATYRDGIFYDLSNIAVRVIAWMPYPEPAKKRRV